MSRSRQSRLGDPGEDLRFPNHPEVGSADIRAEDIRFHPEAARIEALGNASQYGNSFDDWGNRFTV